MPDCIIGVKFDDVEDGMIIASGIHIRIPDGTSAFEARRIILQQITHCLDYYAVNEMIDHLKYRGVIRESTRA